MATEFGVGRGKVFPASKARSLLNPARRLVQSPGRVVKALARGRPVDLVIAPFVFRLRRRLEGAPSHEVVSLHWLPLERVAAAEARSLLQYQYEESVLELPCVRIDGLVIWGLTYRMFESLRLILGEPGTGTLVKEGEGGE